MSKSLYIVRTLCLTSCLFSSPSLVFVHGLRGDSRKTWTSTKSILTSPEKSSNSRGARLSRVFKKRASQPSASLSPEVTKSEASSETSKVFWPCDLLGPDLQNVRILTYGYDARISTILNKATDGSIFTIAQDLVTRLELSRQIDGMENVPIIFAAHSLGGLVVKDVQYPSLYVLSQPLMTNHRLSNFLKTKLDFNIICTPYSRILMASCFLVHLTVVVRWFRWES